MIDSVSYESGFATSPGEAENSGLRSGSQGLWMPRLGITGATVHDPNGLYDGVLTNMAPASDWGIVDDKGITLTLDGSNEYIDVAGPQNAMAGKTRATIAMLAKRTAGTITTFGFGSTEGSRFNLVHFTDNKVYCQIENASGSFPNASDAVAGWKLYVMVYDAALVGFARVALWVNGVELALTPASNPPPTALASAANLGNFTIGAELANSRYSTGPFSWSGIWDRVLQPDEIRQLYRDADATVRLAERRVFATAVAAGNRRRRILLGAAA